MSNPFDQFTNDFQAALPPVPPMGQPSYPPPQQQQGYGGDPYGGQQPAYGGGPTYEQQSPSRPNIGQNSYDPRLSSISAPFANDSYSGFGAQTQPEAPPLDSGNPFASMEAYPPVGNQGYSQPSYDMAQQAGTSFPPAIPPGQPPVSDPSLGYPPPPPAPDASAYADPWGATVQQQQSGYGAMQPPMFSAQPSEQDPAAGTPAPVLQQPNPYAQMQQPQYDPNAGALVPVQQPSNPYAQPQPHGQPPNVYGQDPYAHQMPPQQDPYGHQQGYGQPPVQNLYGQPQEFGQAYGQPPSQQYHQPPPPPVDPFSVFENQSKAPEPPSQSTAMVPFSAPNPTASDDDFWGSFGANDPQPEEPAPAPAVEVRENKQKVEEEKKGDEGLPPGGEFYDARIFTPTLGVMFFKPQELTDSLFLNTERDIVDALGERPVVAFIVEGSSARAAGVELGHVLLKVNGVDVRSPKEASRLIKEGPRPLPLLFYVPNSDVVTAEGEHMVKYDTRETTAPNSAKDWKPKYVVIGGIIAQPWMMNMYRSKSEYDIAVIETQARRPVSVKVKQFSLQGARIQNDWQGPQMVKYKNKLHPWKYIVVLPVARNPIKISSPNLSQLKPVHEGIRRVLLAQQRDRGGPSRREPNPTGESHGRAYNGISDDRGYAPQQPVSANRY